MAADNSSRERGSRRSLDPGSQSPLPYKRSKRDPASPSSSSRDHENHRTKNRSRERERRPLSRSRSPRRDRRSHRDGSRDKSYSSRRDHDRGSRRHRSRERHRRRSRSKDGRRSSKALPPQQDAFDNETAVIRKSPQPEKQKPNFGNTGRLAAESNTVTSVDGQAIVLKYHEPPEARKPPTKQAWRLYVFKDSEIIETVELASRTCWLFGREHAVVDFPIDHPSCSKQHAVLQFRYVERKNEYGDRIGKVKPYMIDLESANGTEVNGERIPAERYFELMDKDTFKFGLSSREYVLMLPPPG